MSSSQGSVVAAPAPPRTPTQLFIAGAWRARLPWGGLKASGLGRELGWAGIEGNTEEKTVTITL